MGVKTTFTTETIVGEEGMIESQSGIVISPEAAAVYRQEKIVTSAGTVVIKEVSVI